MKVGSLLGIPAFLRVVTSFPAPEIVLAAAMEGPLKQFSPCACRVMALDGEDLITVITHGHSVEEIDRYLIIPRSSPVRTWQAIDAGSPVVTHHHALAPQADGVDAGFKDSIVKRTRALSVVRARLDLGDRPIGAVGLLTLAPWSGEGGQVLDVVLGALAWWLAHPLSGCAARVAAARTRGGAVPMVMTEREQLILSRVALGESNKDIAAAMGLSVSSVKADLSSLIRTLGASNRRDAVARARQGGLL